MKKFNTDNSIESPTLITPFSLVHLITSATLFYIIRLYTSNTAYIVIIVLIIHTIYELKDYYTTYINKIEIKNPNYFASFFSNNTIENSIGDTIFCIIGVVIAYFCMVKTDLTIKYLRKTSIVLNIIVFSILAILRID